MNFMRLYLDYLKKPDRLENERCWNNYKTNILQNIRDGDTS